MNLDEFIHALGGPSAAAPMFGIGRTAIQNWLAVGRVPRRWHLRIVRIAAARGLAFDPEAPPPEKAA